MALVLLLLFVSTGCSTLTLADLQARNPDAYAGRICAFPREVPEGVRIIAYQRNTQRIVTDDDEMEIKLFAPAADVFLEYDPDAPLSSIDVLPSSMGLSCRKRTRALPASTVLFQEKQSPCPVETAESDVLRQPRGLARFVEEILGNERPDVRFLGQSSAPTRSPWLQPLPGVAYPPNCETLIRKAAKRDAARVSEDIGKRFGRAMGDYQSSFNSVGVMDAKRRMEILRKYPITFETLQIDLAQKLNAIPELPVYDDPEVAQAALEGFERGYGAGMDEAKRQALAIDLAWALAQSLCGNVACAVETAGIKALQLAVARLRAMPLFIPGATNGVGFFFKRLPQASAQGTTTATAGAAATEANTTETAVRTFTRVKPSAAETPPSTVGTNAAPSVAKTIAGATEPNGQLHHAISERVFAAIQKNDKLRGSFKLRDSQYTARAANLEAHNGYQKWHQDLDDEIIRKIKADDFHSAKDFAAWLYKRYKQPDLVKRFPNGLGANQ
jgi:hypothetical protein